MKKLASCVLVWLSLAALACAAGDKISGKTHPDTSEWQPLFAPDLSNADKPEGIWTVSDGVVTASQDRAIWTRRDYENFVLDLEFKFERGGNSGAFLRVGDPNNHVNTGFEVQILDTHGKKKLTAHDCGGIIGTAAASKNMVKPAGKWNRYVILCRGDKVSVVLNGERIIEDLELSKTKLKDRPPRGYIGFQDEAKRVWYRNVRIQEIGQCGPGESPR